MFEATTNGTPLSRKLNIATQDVSPFDRDMKLGAKRKPLRTRVRRKLAKNWISTERFSLHNDHKIINVSRYVQPIFQPY